jgi:hypothetical protein
MLTGAECRAFLWVDACRAVSRVVGREVPSRFRKNNARRLEGEHGAEPTTSPCMNPPDGARVPTTSENGRYPRFIPQWKEAFVYRMGKDSKRHDECSPLCAFLFGRARLP